MPHVLLNINVYFYMIAWRYIYSFSLKGMRIDVVFPREVYEFLERLCQKMQTVPTTHPTTNVPIPDPTTGQPVPMSRTGKVNEFMHAAIMQRIFTHCYTISKLLALFHPLAMRVGCLVFGGTDFRHCKTVCKQNSMAPRKINSGRA